MLNPKPQRPVMFFHFILAFAVCFLWRLAPWRPPNVEPLLATTMPLARRYGAIGGLLFTFLSIFLFDLATSGITQWTFVAGITYGIIGLAAPLFVRFQKRILSYVIYAIIATLFFDFITGVVAGSVLFGMSWSEGFIGQIPFTINHLIGNVLLAVSLSPLVDFLIQKQLSRPSPVIFPAGKV